MNRRQFAISSAGFLTTVFMIDDAEARTRRRRHRRRPVVTRQEPAHCVVDRSTFDIIDGTDMFERRYPASLTKIMTAMVMHDAIQDGLFPPDHDLADPYSALISPTGFSLTRPVSRRTIQITAGDSFTLHHAMELLAVTSNNTIATYLAEVIGARLNPDAVTDREKRYAFYDAMDRKAISILPPERIAAVVERYSDVITAIPLQNRPYRHSPYRPMSNFSNADGLPGQNDHVTNAWEMACFMAYFQNNYPGAELFFGCPETHFGSRRFSNSNRLLHPEGPLLRTASDVTLTSHATCFSAVGASLDTQPGGVLGTVMHLETLSLPLTQETCASESETLDEEWDSEEFDLSEEEWDTLAESDLPPEVAFVRQQRFVRSGKTGFTNQAGFNLVVAADIAGRPIAASVFGRSSAVNASLAAARCILRAGGVEPTHIAELVSERVRTSP